MNIYKEATNNTPDFTGTVSGYIKSCLSICVGSRIISVFPGQNLCFSALMCMKVGNRCAAFKSGDIIEYKQAG